jgi:DNA polymerase-3 subunit alpha
VDYAQNKKDDKKYGQSSLFEETGEKEYPDFIFEEIPEWERAERLRIEKELIGFYFSGHPMDDYRTVWEQLVTLNLAAPDRGLTGAQTLVGIIKSLSRPFINKKGEEMCFATLADYNGEISLTFFHKAWRDYKDRIAVDRIVAVKGKIDRFRNQEQAGFIVDELLDLDYLAKNAAKMASKGSPGKRGEAEDRAPAGTGRLPGEMPETKKNTDPSYREVHIRLDQTAVEQEETLYPLRDYLVDNPGPCSVFIHVPSAEGETVIRTTTQLSAAANDPAINGLTHCAGVAKVWCE